MALENFKTRGDFSDHFTAAAKGRENSAPPVKNSPFLKSGPQSWQNKLRVLPVYSLLNP